MANEKELRVRQQQKNDIEAHWQIAGENGFVPLRGEIIVYSDLNKIKIGDGINNVNVLEFIYEGEGEDSFELSKKVTALTDDAAAFGSHYIDESEDLPLYSGALGYYFSKIDLDNKIIVLSKTFVIPTIGTYEEADIDNTLSASYNINEQFSIVNGMHYDLCGTIAAINANIVTYSEDSLGFDTIAEMSNIRYHDYTFMVPSQPEIGITQISKSAFATGVGNIAAGEGSFTSGRRNISAGCYSHTEGDQNIAIYAAHAEGRSSKALGVASHAEGQETTASGNYSHTEGRGTVATAQFSHAEGRGSEATGLASHAEGYTTKASGVYSHAEGANTIASGSRSHAEGYYTIAKSTFQHVQGKFNVEDASGNYAHIVGNGESEESRSNAHTVDWDGNAWFAGDVYVSGVSQDEGEKLITLKETTGRITSGNGEIFNDYENNAAASYAHAEGISTTASGYTSHAEGQGSTATGSRSHAEGFNTYASGHAAHAEGRGYSIDIDGDGSKEGPSGAYGAYSHVEGKGTYTEGEAAHAEGAYTRAKGVASHAEGKESNANGNYSHAEGLGSTASGQAAHAQGQYSNAAGNNSFASGYRAYALSDYQTTLGKNNIQDSGGKHAFIIGNGEAYSPASSRSNAMTVDWSGNAWFKGEAFVGEGNHQAATAKKLATEEYVDNVVEKITINGSTIYHRYPGIFLERSTPEGIDYVIRGDANTEEFDQFVSKAKENDYIITTMGIFRITSIDYGYREIYLASYLIPVGRLQYTGDGTYGESFNNNGIFANNTASGVNSHAEGWNSIAKYFCQHVEGCSNIEDTYAGNMPDISQSMGNYLHIIGNGGFAETEVEPGMWTPIAFNSNAFTVDWDGNGTFSGAVNSATGADYAEYFEWEDGNPEAEDRVGYVVALNGEKIHRAAPGEEVLGIVSGTAAVVGDTAEWEWQGKYLRDEFGRLITEEVEQFIERVDPETNEKTKISLGFRKVPKLNPDYDESQAYMRREDRPEWATVGMFGKLYVRDDGTCEVNKYAKVGEDGTLTFSTEKTSMRVLSRTNTNVIRVLLIP